MNDLRHEPFDLAIEQELLGSLLRDNSLITAAAAELGADNFHDPLHGRIFQTILAMSGSRVTPLTLHTTMKADPGLVEVGGQTYLDGLRIAAPAIPDLKDWIIWLKDYTTRRAVLTLAGDMEAKVYLPPSEMPSQRLTGDATEALLALAGSHTPDRTQSLSAVAASRLRLAEKRLDGEVVPFIKTGLVRLDRAMGGLQPGDHMVIAGRSGMGKTAVAGSIGRGAAQDGAPVLAISSDMTKERWAERTLCDVDHLLTGGVIPIHYGRFRGRMSQEMIGRLAVAQTELVQWPYDICDEGEITISRIRAKVRAMANRYKDKQGLLIVDFLQKISMDNPGRDRRRDEDITAVTYAIGDIVKDAGWSAVSLAQMKNKDTDVRGRLREDAPNESDIRESGGILMAADIVIALHRKAFFVERREPPGRDFSPEPPLEWNDWNTELQACKDEMQFIGFKNRDDSISKLNMTLWCEMGSNALRDYRPGRERMQAVKDEDAAAILV